MAKAIDFKKITIRKQINSRGGGLEIDLGKIDNKYADEKMTVYQNYLGGGMLGKVANDCTVSNWKSDTKLSEVALELKKYFFGLTANYSDEAFEFNQTLSISSY